MNPWLVMATWVVPLAAGFVSGYRWAVKDEASLRDDIEARFRRLARLAPVDSLDAALWDAELEATS